jgi:hypothetical protein
MSTSSNNWNDNIERLLNDIRLNCIELEKHHTRLYFSIKNIVVYFKLPIIILSSLNAIIAVALQSYIAQNIISATNCLLSFIIGVLTSVSLYLKIEDRLENELLASKEYHKISIEIYKVLSLKTSDRSIDGDQFLNDIYNEYIKLYDMSNLGEFELSDKLKSELKRDIDISLKILDN